MNHARRFAPLPFLPPFLSWTVDADGTLLTMAGPAEDRFAVEVGTVIGQDYRVVFRVEPEAREVIRRALAGGTVAVQTGAWGARWFNIARPTAGGVDGWSILLPDEVEEPQPDGVHTWTVLDAIRGEGLTLEAGAALRYDGTAMVKGTVVDSEAAIRLIRRHPDRVRYHQTADESSPPLPTQGDPRGGAGPFGPLLRLVR